MMVFLSVFCLSAIFNISGPVQYMENGITDAKSISMARPESRELLTPDYNDDTIELNSFSYSTNSFVTRWNDPGPVSAAIKDITEVSRINGAADISGSTKRKDSLYANIGISIASHFVNIRRGPSAESEALGKLYKDSAAEILEDYGDWYYVESGSVKGYVKAEYVKTGIPEEELIEKYGEESILVTVDGLNVRGRADTAAERLSVIHKDEIYPIEALEGNWIKIRIPENQVVGYIKREYADKIIDFKDAISKEEEAELLALQAGKWSKAETRIRQQEGVSYSKEELKLLACLVQAEAGSQSYEGKLAVANIVLNRVKSSLYPDSIKAVIYQSGQFTVAASGSLTEQLEDYSHYSSHSEKQSINAAKAALEGDNNIGSRMYFHSYKAALKKGYDEKSGSVKLGDHLFW
jgi:spore germination cell wall hydrolase CwlJ-like protein/SH3-like domain-containing protein